MSVQEPKARRKRSTKIIFVNSRVLRRLDITRIAVEIFGGGKYLQIFRNGSIRKYLEIFVGGK
jgi:hypothetical protein